MTITTFKGPVRSQGGFISGAGTVGNIVTAETNPLTGRMTEEAGGVVLPVKVANGSLVIEDQKSTLAIATARAKKWLTRPLALASWTYKGFPGTTMTAVENGVMKMRSVVGNYIEAYHSFAPTLIPERMVVYIDSPDWTKIDTILLQLTTADGSTGWRWQWTRASFVEFYGSGRRALTINKRDYKLLIGTPDASTTSLEKLTINVATYGAGNQNETWFCGIERDVPKVNPRATISIGADDCEAIWFANGLPILQAAGINNSYVACIYDMLDTGGYATKAQVSAHVASGGEVIVHGPIGNGVGVNGDLRKYADYAGVYADIKYHRDNIVASGWGINGSETIYVFPRGIFDLATGDDAIYRALRDLGFKSARGTAILTAPQYWSQYRERRDGHGYSVKNIGHLWAGSAPLEVTNIAAIISTIDLGVADGADMSMVFHEVVAGAATASTQIAAADFQTIVNRIAYHVSNGALDVMRPSEQWLPFYQDVQL